MKSALVVTVDGINSRFLGAYGNSWVPTPHLDRLAAHADVFDFFIAESLDPSALFLSSVSGVHAAAIELGCVPKSVGFFNAEIKSVLITDDPVIGALVEDSFDEVISLQTEDQDSDIASQSDSDYHRLFAVAAESWQNQNAEQPLLFWVHTKGMFGRWDAPIEMQQWFKGEEDPPPFSFLQTPSLQLEADYDPDERLKLLHGYAAQVCQFDQAFGEFKAAFSTPAAPSMTIFAGLRGFPLGEHRIVGQGQGEEVKSVNMVSGKKITPAGLHAEQLHVPLFCSHAGEDAAGKRLPKLQQTGDLYGIIKNWFDGCDEPPGDEDARIANLDLCAVSLGNQAIRIQTSAWSYSHAMGAPFQLDTQQPGNLFVKPDDRLEVNEVGDSCPDVVDAMVGVLAGHLVSLQQHGTLSRLPLPKALHLGTE
ncbi:MAG: hypothetical protein P8M80_11570 [Pirellulaceae bacterium]|nr:hypothetical protein [Pirellulaceae bacterium]